jgi:hypothetical protein
MRCLALCLAVAALTAAEPTPAVFIPASADLAVQVPDLERSRARWAATPYPRLLATGWGRMLVGEWGMRLNKMAPGAGEALAGLRSAALAMQGDAPQVTVAAIGGPQLPALLAVTGLPGRQMALGPVVAWTSGATLAPGIAPAAPAALADAGIRLQPGRRLPAFAGELLVDLQLDAAGLRETAVVAPTDALRLAAANPRTWADPQELRRLPATTLWAATWHGDPELAAALPGQDAAGTDTLERWLAQAALPGWRETLAACRGPSVVWMAEGAPFPTLNAAVSVDEAVARRWIAAATAQLNLGATPEGASGFVGLVPFTIAWSADRRLVLSSDPQGLAVWQSAKPGFAALPGVAAALAQVPPRTVLLGVGRGGASWAALAQLSVPLFTAMGAPQAVSLPGDLRTAGDRGWLYLRLMEDGSLRGESGGLFGGPFAVTTAATLAVPATLWLQGQLRNERKVPQAEPDPDVPAPAPVF